MVLLERVGTFVRLDSSGVSSASQEKKSLLKKSESFQRKQRFLQKALGMRKEIEKRETYSSTSSRSSTDPIVKSQAFSEESVNDPQADLRRSEEFSLPDLGGDIPESDE
ncbi:GAF domain-containing protein, partial [Leptospira borgpetersenii serovar Hardjo-bovis]|nr:GAF domain-containing protein [Leptospira borgpetersenii serovar Hardjo-bovis]